VRERDRPYGAGVLELEEQPVAARGRERRRESDAVVLRVHVQERQVALAQRDEVAAGAEVRLDLDRLAVARDREAEPGLLARVRGAASSRTS
jgi:hypothetical protein